jgi:uncharacterized cupredoxin-like copper-binding protein
MRRTPVALAAAAAMASALVVAVTGWPSEGAATSDGPSLGPGPATVAIDIHHSRFSRERINLEPGTLLRFVVTNDDPIVHELVVGDETVHARHAAGTEAVHPPVPGEVTVRPGEVGVTSMRFDHPGTFVFACHLPGHLRYGMHGEVVVG